MTEARSDRFFRCVLDAFAFLESDFGFAPPSAERSGPAAGSMTFRRAGDYTLIIGLSPRGELYPIIRRGDHEVCVQAALEWAGAPWVPVGGIRPDDWPCQDVAALASMVRWHLLPILTAREGVFDDVVQYVDVRYALQKEYGENPTDARFRRRCNRLLRAFTTQAFEEFMTLAETDPYARTMAVQRAYEYASVRRATSK